MSEIVRINGYDAQAQYGVVFPPSAINAIMTPASLKEFVTNESRDEDGSRIIFHNPRQAQRELTIEMHLHASSQQQLISRYKQLIRIFEAGMFTIELVDRNPGDIYRFIYESCNSFSMGERLAKFVLKLIEPNPTNR